MKKKIFSSIAFSVLSFIAYIYVFICVKTSRWQKEGMSILRENRDKPVIIAFWHSRLLVMPAMAAKLNRQVSVIISRHGDGELIAGVMKFFGMKTIRGSSRHKGKNRGGAQALKDAIRTIKSGGSIAITPDGPRGPRMRVTGKIIEIAKITGAPIIPMSYSARPAKIFASWDRFMLALPFCKIYYICGEPIKINKDAKGQELEKYKAKLENSLNSMTQELDSKAGVNGILPE